MSCENEINISTTIIQENIDVTATPIDEVVDINVSQITEVIELSLVSCEHVVNIISGTTIDPSNYDLADFQNANANYFIRLDEFVAGLDGKVDKVIGETLIPITALDKLNAIEDGAQVNIIESINVNGVELVVNPNKSVDIFIPLSLGSLNDVSFASKQNQQGVYFNSTTSKWQNGWNWFQYASGFEQGTIPTLISDVGGVQKFEYTYTFGTRYRKISSSIDGFYTDLACTDLIIKKEL